MSQMGPARRAQECRRSAVEHRRSDSESRGWLESCGGVVETGGGCERSKISVGLEDTLNSARINE